MRMYTSRLRAVFSWADKESLYERSHGSGKGSEGRATARPWRSAIAGAGVGQPRGGCAVGGAPMGERTRAGFRRDCGAVLTTEPRDGRAGCGRIAQTAFCGALVLVALAQPSNRPRAGEEPTEATTPRARTERGEENRVRKERATDERGVCDGGAHAPRGRSEAGELPLISSYISPRGNLNECQKVIEY